MLVSNQPKLNLLKKTQWAEERTKLD